MTQIHNRVHEIKASTPPGAKTLSKESSYQLYVVFRLPTIEEVKNSVTGTKLGAEEFIHLVLKNANRRNHKNQADYTIPHSQYYFTSKGHLARERIPHTFARNNDEFGILALKVTENDDVKIKGFNQRTVAINPAILTPDRLEAIYYPKSYINLSFLGELVEPPTEEFNWVNVRSIPQLRH